MIRSSVLSFALCCGAAVSAIAAPVKTGTCEVLYSFMGGNDGSLPLASVIDVAGTLYGTTSLGGTAGAGTVFALNPNTGVETVLHSFSGGQADGKTPGAELLNVDGTLYGTAESGGKYGFGVIFSLDIKTGTEQVVYSFAGKDDGITPFVGLIRIHDMLYGTTKFGGVYHGGTLFSLSWRNGVETVIHSFGNKFDGNSPEGALLDVDSKLYGTTITGGAAGSGTVFRVDSDTGAERVVHSFYGPDGANPSAGLVNIGNTLYGVTSEGGAYLSGVVFSVQRKTGAETVLHSFDGDDGEEPLGRLVRLKGLLFGTTSHGGQGRCSNGCGTLFSVDRKTGSTIVEHSFHFRSGKDGAGPQAGLLKVGGIFYGTTGRGGNAENEGAVFKYTP